MKIWIFSLVVLAFGASCATTGFNPAVRSPADEEEIAKKTAFDFGNSYCTYFRKYAEGHLADADVAKAEERIYVALCSTPEKMFAPLAAVNDKTRYAVHVLILDQAVINVENSIDSIHSPIFATLRSQIDEYNQRLFYGTESPFKKFVVKEGLTTSDKYESYFEQFSRKAEDIAEGIRNPKKDSK